jgi:SAM-dependent methyltransferase
MYNTRNQFHTKARLLLNTHMQDKMQQMFGNGYDSGDIEKGFDDPLILKEFKLTGANYKLIFDELIKPRLGAGRTVLEIGPGKGSWTKAVLANFPDGVLYVIDRLPLEQMIRERCPSVGDRLRFVQTDSNDYFSIPNNLFDFAFSFGVLVHLPLREIEIILTRLRPKMRAGGEMILHYSNWDKLDRRGWERTAVPRWFKDSPDHPDVWWTKNSCETMKSISEKSGFIVLSPNLGYFDSCSVLHLRTRSCI